MQLVIVSMCALTPKTLTLEYPRNMLPVPVGFLDYWRKKLQGNLHHFHRRLTISGDRSIFRGFLLSTNVSRLIRSVFFSDRNVCEYLNVYGRSWFFASPCQPISWFRNFIYDYTFVVKRFNSMKPPRSVYFRNEKRSCRWLRAGKKIGRHIIPRDMQAVWEGGGG